MPGLSYLPGDNHLERAGLRYISTGNGSPQDFEVVKARKARACQHEGPWNRRLSPPCEHPEIRPGDLVVMTRQSFLESSSLSMPCAIAAGIYAPAHVSTHCDPTRETR
jgi:hypothetical protein